jgi:hypothetical protein
MIAQPLEGDGTFVVQDRIDVPTDDESGFRVSFLFNFRISRDTAW